MITDALNWLRTFPNRYARVVASGSYVPQIDGLRFLAIMQVVIYHSVLRGDRAIAPGRPASEGPIAWFPNGSAGVELFFFISGYIIAFPFLSGRAPSLSQFYKRRLYRLEPPYILVLIGCFLLLSLSGYRPEDAVAFNKSSQPLWQSLLASMVYLHGILFAAPPRLNPPLWSLEIEIQFYLLAPFLLLAYRRIRDDRARVGLAFGIAIIGIVTQPWLTRSATTNYLLISHFYAFWLGIAMCDVAVRTNPFAAPAQRRWDLGMLAGLVMLIASSTLFYAFATVWENALVLLARGVSILLLYMGAARGTIGRRLFGTPWITLIGGACYSIYLTHVPVLQASSTVFFRLIKPTSLAEAWVLGPLLCIGPVMIVGLTYYVVVERFCMQKDWPQRLRALLMRRRSSNA